MQKLILPINKTKLTASWKTAAYTNKFGYIHYGCDMVSIVGSQTVYASGSGVVVASGFDNVVGNVIAVLYLDARNSRTGAVRDIVMRYFHFDTKKVNKWDKITKDTVLGLYGSTGLVGTGRHLHIEVDSDIAYPLYSPTVLSSSLLRGRSIGANDKTMSNPLEWLFCKMSPPDYQTFITANDAYIREEDKIITTTVTI